MRTAKTHISLGICPVSSESSQWAQCVAKDRRFLYAGSEDSDLTADLSLAWRTVILLVLSWGSSVIETTDHHNPGKG